MAGVLGLGILQRRRAAGNIGPVFGQRRLLHGQVSAGESEIGAGRSHTSLEALGIDAGNDLAGRHLGVEIGQKLGDLARDLRANLHRGYRIDLAGGRYRHLDGALFDLGQAIAGRRLVGLRAPIMVSRSSAGDDDDCQDEKAAHDGSSTISGLCRPVAKHAPEFVDGPQRHHDYGSH